MLPFIFLILGSIFANPQVTQKIYECAYMVTKSEAGSTSSSPFTMREIAEACKEEIGANNIKIEEANVSGNIHHLKLSWTTGSETRSQRYFFNVIGSTVCNESGSSKGSLQSFLLDVDEIMNNTENSFMANSCETKESRNLTVGGQKVKIRELGYKTQKNGTCKKICGPNETFTAEKFYIESQLVDPKCTTCPSSSNPNYQHYTQTKPNENGCFDLNGCPEGMELVDVAPKNLNLYPVTVGGRKRLCSHVCPAHMVRSVDGNCEVDEKKSCEHLKTISARLDSIASRFNTLSQKSTVGSCNMEKLRAHMKNWVKEGKESITRSLNSSNCAENEFFEYIIPSNFVMYLWTKEAKPCTNDFSGTNKSFDLTLYKIINEYALE